MGGATVAETEERTAPGREEAIRFFALIALQLSVDLCCFAFAQIRMKPELTLEEWNRSHHVLSVDLLRDAFWENILLLHGQPPLFSGWTALFFKWGGDDPLPYLHVANCMLAALTAALVYPLLRAMTGRPRFAFNMAALLAMNPALVLFAAYPYYDIITCFWVTLGAALLACAAMTERARLLSLCGFIAALTALVLTRSLFHVFILAPALALACLIAREQWKHLLAFGLILCLPALGWYGKNAALFGFFGSSSWFGQTLWTAVSANYDRSALQQRVGAGVIEPLPVKIPAWSPPSAYTDDDFNQVDPRPALSRDDFNNINVIEVSRMYGRNAWRLMRAEPLHYFTNVAAAYSAFSAPSSRFSHLEANAAQIPIAEAAWSQAAQGQWLTGQIARVAGRDYFKSLWFFALPLLLVAYLGGVVRWCGLSAMRWAERLRWDGAMVAAALLLVYTAAASSALEYGENERAKFVVEPVLWAFAIAVLHRGWRKLVWKRA